MNKRDIIETLQKDVDIPAVVQMKANAAFEKIQKESEQPKEPVVSQRTQKKIRRFPKKRAAVAVVAATLALATVTVGAAVYIHWSKSLSEGLQVTEEQKQELENSNMVTFVEQSCTDQGITVTAVQSITDNYYTYLAFKVEGYDLPEGAEPCFETINVEVDGRDDFSWGGSFYDGLVEGPDGYAVNADGSAAVPDENGNYGHYIMEDGSMEFQMVLANSREDGFFINKPIHVELKNLGTVAKAEYFPDIEGSWSFDWNLQGADSVKTYEVDVPLGDAGATVKKLEFSPVSLRAEYEFARQEIAEDGEDSDGNPIEYTTYAEPPRLMGVKLKDGTILPYLYGGPGSEGYMDEESDTYLTAFAMDRVIDTEQVDAFLFLKSQPEGEGGFTEENFYVVPLE